MSLWTKDQIITALGLYCQMPFGKIHSRNPLIVEIAEKIDRTPSALAMKMLNLSSLDPAILQSGRSGLGNASALDREVWNEFNNDWESAVTKAQKMLEATAQNFSESNDNIDYSSDDTRRTVLSRTKQPFFRRSILVNYQSRCCISGLSHPQLLIASHIVPWKSDKQNRLNPQNGFCLSALHDKAFDLGLITVMPSYTIKVSESLKVSISNEFGRTSLLSIEGDKISMPEKFYPNPDFLKYHNEFIFQN